MSTGSVSVREFVQRERPKDNDEGGGGVCVWPGARNISYKISGLEEDWRPERPMVQRASSEAPSAGGHRESRMGLGIGYAAYQSGYNKLFTQVIGSGPTLLLSCHFWVLFSWCGCVSTTGLHSFHLKLESNEMYLLSEPRERTILIKFFTSLIPRVQPTPTTRNHRPTCLWTRKRSRFVGKRSDKRLDSWRRPGWVLRRLNCPLVLSRSGHRCLLCWFLTRFSSFQVP